MEAAPMPLAAEYHDSSPANPIPLSEKAGG
jgi:hypothetical protein